MEQIDHFAQKAALVATEHGFETATLENMPTKLMLIVSEAAEALECLRDGTALETSAKVPGVSNIEEELADIVIRTLMTMYDLGFGLPSTAIFGKHDFNATREHKHGGKAF